MNSDRACEGDDGGGGSEDPGDEHDGFPSPLFVDGIADGVGYHRVRDLFYLFGKLRNVFMQRDRKMGRSFRFGFVRFLSMNSAVSALWALNGLKVGGSALRVSWAKPPSPAASRVVEGNVPRGNGGMLSSLCKGPKSNEVRVRGVFKAPGAASWRDVVLSRPPVQVVPRSSAPSDHVTGSEKGCGTKGG